MSKAEKDIEIWKPIQNYEEYMVSNKGRVKRLAYYNTIGNGAKQFRKERIIKPQKRGSGYYHVMLCKNGKHKGFTVHRLVAQAFIPRIEGKDYVDHIDGNRLNNIVSNLRWCSIKENCSFPLARQRMKSSHQKYAMPVIQCDLNGNEIKRYKSMNDATRATGVRSGNISNNCSGYYKTAGGYIWKLANV